MGDLQQGEGGPVEGERAWGYQGKGNEARIMELFTEAKSGSCTLAPCHKPMEWHQQSEELRLRHEDYKAMGWTQVEHYHSEVCCIGGHDPKKLNCLWCSSFRDEIRYWKEIKRHAAPVFEALKGKTALIHNGEEGSCAFYTQEDIIQFLKKCTKMLKGELGVKNGFLTWDSGTWARWRPLRSLMQQN